MHASLLDRQVSLLEYLTSSDAIFGDQGDTPLDQALQGIDRGLLRLEACFSHEKRMEKVIAVFPRTFQMLGDDQGAIVREFVEACPPVDISRVVNAQQFFEFLRDRCRRKLPEPPYLCDVAACEFAFVKARVGTQSPGSELRADQYRPRGGIRRHPGVILLNCAYDIRPVFEASSGIPVPNKRDTLLAVVVPAGARDPSVFELSHPIFAALKALDQWSERSSLGPASELDELISNLVEHGLVEVR